MCETENNVRSVEEANLVVNEKVEPSQDVITKSIGIFGRWHFWICLAIFLVKFPVAWHQLSIVFLTPPVNFTCIDNATDKCDPECSSHVFDRSIFTETIITQWDLVCERQYLASLAQTITMLGILIGNIIFGYISDRYGRRNPLIAAVILQVISGTCAAFSPWFVLFLVMRFLSAFATGGTMITSFVLIMELVGTKWRTTLGILYQIPFNLGHLLLPLISYLQRDWKYYQVSISIPAIILVSYFWILPESPRWLLTVGKTEEGIEVMEKAAQYNNLPTENIRDDVINHVKAKEKTEETKEAGNFLDLVRTPIMRVYTLCICFNWLVCGLCFYGVAQFIGQLGGNIFINVAFSAVIQIPATFFAVWATKVWGRKLTLIAMNGLAGVTCILLGIIPTEPFWIRSVVSCIGMYGLSVSFTTVYIYSGELFPTVIRNVGVGSASMCARVGSMTAPFVADLVRVVTWLPPVIFGVFPLLAAVLCLMLPETLDCKLPDTIEEAEKFQKEAQKLKASKIDVDTEMTTTKH